MSDILSIAIRAASGITILNSNYESADDSSYGEFSVKAETPIGLLVINGYVASDSTPSDVEIELDGTPLDEDQVANFYFEGPPADDQAQALLADAVADFVQQYESA